MRHSLFLLLLLAVGVSAVEAGRPYRYPFAGRPARYPFGFYGPYARYPFASQYYSYEPRYYPDLPLPEPDWTMAPVSW